MSDYFHKSVLGKEVVDFLKPKAGQNFIDCTLGGGGHSESLLKKSAPDGKVLAFELDPYACRAAAQKLKKYKDRLIIVPASYTKLGQYRVKYRDELLGISGIVMDLGLSSDQLDRADRGFSFNDKGDLDMRFDPDGQTVTASEIILRWSEEKLANIFREYGEIKNAGRLARFILKWRESQKKLPTGHKIKTKDFVTAILPILMSKKTNNQSGRRAGQKSYRIHPATQIFQALRMAVNDELENLRTALPQAVEALSKGGRLAVISFHSLEDRIVKQFFQNLTKDCVCPPRDPICHCDRLKNFRLLTKKPIVPGQDEIRDNPRSRSAKLRVIEKL